MSKGIARAKGFTFYLPRADVERAQEKGYALVGDLVAVPGEQVIVAVDNQRLGSVPIGIVREDRFVERVIQERIFADRDRLVRVSQLVSVADISKRTNRSKQTIIEDWMEHPAWPGPITKVGGRRVFYWPDIVKFLLGRGLLVRKKDTGRAIRKEAISRASKERWEARRQTSAGADA